MELIPVGYNVLLKIDAEEETKTESGLVIPKTVQKENVGAVVIAVGPACELLPGDVLGLRAYVKPGEGSLVNLGNEKFLLVDEDSILAYAKA